MNSAEYDDGYPSCERTYVGFRVYDLLPSVVTAALGVEPTWARSRGAIIPGQGIRTHRYRQDAWCFSSQEAVNSSDTRRHLDWLLDRLEAASTTLQNLREEGAAMEISCYWQSAKGDGGPTLSPIQLRRLGSLDLVIWFDFYCFDEEPKESSRKRNMQP